jgi:hypothetical protein
MEKVLNEILEEKQKSSRHSSIHKDSLREQRKIAHAKIAKESSWIVSETWKQSFYSKRLDSCSPEHPKNSANSLAKLVSMTQEIERD